MGTEEANALFEQEPADLLNAALTEFEDGTGIPAPTSVVVETVGQLLEDGVITQRDANLLVGRLE